MFERLGNTVAWITFLAATGWAFWMILVLGVLYFDVKEVPTDPGRFSLIVDIFPVLIYAVAMVTQCVVWGRMRFLPWKK